MSEQNMQDDRAGTTDHPQHRAGPDEGVRADNPGSADEPGPIQNSIFDGKGNEQVVVVGDNKEGRPVQATGDSSEEAQAKVADQDDLLSPAFETPPFEK